MVLLVAGAFFLLAFVFLAFAWFWWIGPFRRAMLHEWLDQNSEKQLWTDVQKSIGRWGWTHNDGFRVRLHGDKEWFARTIEGIGDDDRIGCFAGHKEFALRVMTNQDVPSKAQAWKTWWEENKQKTQEEWIRDGFEQAGISLHTPLTTEDAVALLELLGDLDEEAGSRKHPFHRHFNAFRWLRDSEFDPQTLRLADLPEQDAEVVLTGLVEYSRRLGRSPKSKAAGVLALGRPASGYSMSELPPICLPSVRAGANAIIFSCLVAAIVCLWFPLAAIVKARRRGGSGDDDPGAGRR